MDQTPPPEQDAGAAFEALRGEVSLLRRAVEGLTAERQAMPDYAPTLAQIDGRLHAFVGWAKTVSERPAIALTPEGYAEAIERAGARGRVEDHKALANVTRRLDGQADRFDSMVVRNRSAQRQRQYVHRASAGGFALGILLWSFLPGTVARSLPAAWHVPEKLAARMIGARQ